jgi:hypothetical protein
VIDPWIAFEDTQTENRSFVERFGLDLGDVADSAHVHERYGTDPQRLGRP